MSAAFGAPSMAMADYQDMGMLGQVGAAREAKAQQYASEPYNRLSQYMGLVGGGYGDQTTTSGGAGYSPLLGGLGGAALGTGIADSLGLIGTAGAASSPWLWPVIGGAGLLGLMG